MGLGVCDLSVGCLASLAMLRIGGNVVGKVGLRLRAGTVVGSGGVIG